MYLHAHKQFLVDKEVSDKLTDGEEPLFEVKITALPDERVVHRSYYEFGGTLFMADVINGGDKELGAVSNAFYEVDWNGLRGVADQLERVREMNQESSGADLHIEASGGFDNDAIDILPFTIERDDP